MPILIHKRQNKYELQKFNQDPCKHLRWRALEQEVTAESFCNTGERFCNSG